LAHAVVRWPIEIETIVPTSDLLGFYQGSVELPHQRVAVPLQAGDHALDVLFRVVAVERQADVAVASGPQDLR